MQDLLQIPGINTSRLLLSFLMETSDPQLFMPDSKGGRAGMYATVHVFMGREGGREACVGVYCDVMVISLQEKLSNWFPVFSRKK